MTEKALFHRSGTLVIKNVNGEYQSIEPQLEDLQNQIHENESELSKATDDRSKRTKNKKFYQCEGYLLCPMCPI